jgi:ribosomal 30S subunit maturation factor RimM
MRVEKMRGIDILVVKKKHKNTERILPFPEQLIEKFNPAGRVTATVRILLP